jgi:hypothetical protein
LSRLSPEADDLLQAARAALKPRDADRERVFQALLPQLGGAPSPGGGAQEPSGALSAAKTTVVKTLAVVVGLGVAGGGLFLALRSEAPPEKAAVVTATTTPPTAPTPTEQAPEGAAPVEPRAQPVKRPAVAVHGADRLAQEIAILSLASAELHAGRPAAALRALADHQKRFPAGVLTQERTAARVQALCALGRTEEAKDELARLARTSPNSPHEARARKACGFAPTDG